MNNPVRLACDEVDSSRFNRRDDRRAGSQFEFEVRLLGYIGHQGKACIERDLEERPV